jgi:5-methylcytosine-specific restriction endonuclease McrA
MKSQKAKVCDIPKKVKDIVWERDNHRCVICGDSRAFPNAHYIPRSQGGLGIEQNIVTLCGNFSPNHCHYTYDFGSREQRDDIRQKLRDYLSSHYDDWEEEKLKYRRF